VGGFGPPFFDKFTAYMWMGGVGPPIFWDKFTPMHSARLQSCQQTFAIRLQF
jgi:hypothetical protein